MSRNVAKEILDGSDEFVANTFESMTSQGFKDFCYLAVIQQDRDTRHACAELVLTEELESDAKNRMHSAIMNCKGGFK